MIVCLLVPYFIATLSRREHKIGDNVPIIVCSGQKVTATCAVASMNGVRVGMAVRQATWLCPNAEVFTANRSLIRQTQDQIVKVLGEFTHLVEIEGVSQTGKIRIPTTADGRQSTVIYVDLERLAHQEAARLAQMMGRSIREVIGLDAACGLASGKFPSYAAAAGTPVRHLRVIVPGEEAATLAPLPLALLPSKEETRRRLALLGLESIGALAALPLSAALTQCGKDGRFLYHLAHGMDSRRVVPTAPQVVEQVGRTFEAPISDQQVLTAILRSMATELSVRLRMSGSMGKTMILHLTFDGGISVQEKTTLRTFVSSSRFITDTLARLFARMSVSAGVYSVTVTLADLVPFAGQQLELFTDQPKAREQLQQRLSTIMKQANATDFYWVTEQYPVARRIEQRYRLERVIST